MSGYYKYLQTLKREDKDIEAINIITAIFEKKRKKAGYRTITMLLPVEWQMNHKKVRRLMRKAHLFCKVRKANPYHAMNKATQEHNTYENVLNREFKAIETPYTFFGTDITYLYYQGRPAYLSIIKDMLTGEIVAAHCSQYITLDIVTQTLNKFEKNVPLEYINGSGIHSDRGFHYTHPSYHLRLEQFGMIQSMSRKGKCIDNAPTESFFGHMKDELDWKDCLTFNELEVRVYSYIEDYNYNRPQWARKKMTPIEYRNHLLAA